MKKLIKYLFPLIIIGTFLFQVSSASAAPDGCDYLKNKAEKYQSEKNNYQTKIRLQTKKLRLEKSEARKKTARYLKLKYIAQTSSPRSISKKFLVKIKRAKQESLKQGKIVKGIELDIKNNSAILKSYKAALKKNKQLQKQNKCK